MKIAFIHHEQKLKVKVRYGAAYINDLISNELKKNGVDVRHFYPKVKLVDAPHHLKGFNNILFFFGLLEMRNEILSCNIIQGTTYTPIAFLSFSTPIVSHFGSTTYGFIYSTPRTNQIERKLTKILHEFKKAGIVNELNIKTRRPLRDIADIEKLVAKRATAIIATSEIVKKDLENNGIDKNKIHIVHNAIENFWFNGIKSVFSSAELIYLGRMGQDIFTFKLKGLDRLVYIYRAFKQIPKLSIIMTGNKKVAPWLRSSISSHTVHTNLFKEEIKKKLETRCGSILLITSRYEGFCLSMAEGMSQGLIPVAFPVGVAPEIIKNGKNGYVVNSVEEMIEKIKFILENKEHRKKLSLGAIQTAKQFRPQNMTKKLISIYNDIIAKQPNKDEYRRNKSIQRFNNSHINNISQKLLRT